MLRQFLFVTLLFPILLLASIGKISSMDGKIVIVRSSGEVKAVNGSMLEQKDVVKSIGNSKAQLTFKDNTVVTVGADTTFEIDEYVYGDAGKEPKAKFGIPSGTFKAITGQIGKVKSDNLNFKARTATIGIRGTHLFGEVSNEIEKFGCTKGVIFVVANNVTVDVPAGYITEVRPGLTPSMPRKIEDADMKLTSSSLKESLKQIKNIKDDDTRNKLLNQLENQLNQAFEASLGKNLAINQAFNDGYKTNDGYAPLEWGFYTPTDDSKVIVKSGSSYMVDGKKYSTLMSAYNSTLPVSLQITQNKDGTYSVAGQSYQFLSIAIANTNSAYKFAIPLEKVQGAADFTNSIKNSGSKYLVLNDKGTIEAYRASITNTPEDVIKGYMGTPSGQSTAYDSWDGQAASKTVTEYKGVSIGSVSYPNQDIKNSLIESTNNSTYLLFDFGNRYLTGSINFVAIDPKTSKTENWQLKIASIGKSTISTTGFFVDNGYFGSGQLENSLIGANGFYNRFSGAAANEVSGFFEFISNDSGKTVDDKVAYGLFLAGKTNSYQLNRQELGKNEYFSWGYWAKDSIGDKSDKAIIAATPIGSYIQSTLDTTTKDVIDGYSANSIKASYKGDVFGTVLYPIDGKATDLMKNGTAALDFDFKNKSVSGAIGFDAGSDKWAVALNKGTIGDADFVLKGAGSVNKTESIDSFAGNGKFFGKDAQAAGGGFNAASNSGKVAIGSFSTLKK